MGIIACGSRPSRRGPAQSFTRMVWQDPIIQAPDPAPDVMCNACPSGSVCQKVRSPRSRMHERRNSDT